ncbi:MAG: TRAP transporter substrate-binding protein [Rhodospirillales bacterium]|jgi:TRAP-type C4-dicarboxylate transport system substrate-binding protein|nr:C4-dicarboxylate ABC transporter [Rhodospirillaceae bacterium]MDP6428275.1 TRAP transporter substrate-binding protein [Rhodospirillales bacterium]MDP6646140.1 TRAP transporter substrate-binding protein [Rhodospirillales bacterium]MDP6840689.1 TRAP transporter substrate-binding protein [Rhodospirillales bacterium]|tara:strand:+ start:491 stop:1531 length:1041 start_codon:yes stop_codon:yes gene_type:complete
MKKTLLSAAAGAALALGAFGVNGASAAEVTLRMHTFIPPVANPAKHFLAPWAKKIGKASGGRIQVKPFWAMALGGKAPQLIDQVKDGVVDVAWTLPGFTAGRMPRAEVFELPFVHRDAISTTLAMQDFKDKHLQNEMKDFHVLIMHAHAGVMFMTKKPVLKIEDLKGMTLRGHNRIGVWFLQALGTAGIATPLGRIPSMLSKNVIQGSMLPFEIAPAVKMHELTSHFSTLSGDQPRMATAVFTFMMNKNSYAKLPPDLKKVIDDNSGRNIARSIGQTWENIEIPGEKVMRSKSKNKFHVINPAESKRIKDAAKGVYKRWFGVVGKVGVDGPALLADALAMIAKHAK